MSGPPRTGRAQSGATTQAQLAAAHEDLEERVNEQAMLIAGHHGWMQGLETTVSAVQSSGSALQSNFTAWTATAIGVAALLIAVVVGGFTVLWTEQSSISRDLGDLKQNVQTLVNRPATFAPAPVAPPKK